MRQLLPSPAEVDPAAEHRRAARPAPDGRPWVLLNMVSSVDGATAIDGRSGALGGPGDREVFGAIRAVADVILVAAGTVRAEGYGPPRTPADRRAQREAAGQAPFPRLAVISRTLDLDPGAPLFAEAPEPPLVFTGADAPPHRHRALAPVAEVVVARSPSVDVADVVADLGARGARVVLCEGGPSLNGQLLAADLVDEVNLTLAAQVVGGAAARLATGAPADDRALVLAHLWERDGDLFARYLRAPG